MTQHILSTPKQHSSNAGHWSTIVDGTHLMYWRNMNGMSGCKHHMYLKVANYENPSSSFARGPWCLGDHKCWTIKLLPILTLHQSYMDSNTWNLHYFGRGGLSNWKIFLTHNWMLLKEKWMFDNISLIDRVRGFAMTTFINVFKKGKLYRAA